MKYPFDLATVLNRIAQTMAVYPRAAMFELYERGYTSLFEQLIACIISIRTLDETTIPVAEQLFSLARTPDTIAKLAPAHLERIISRSTFAEQKSHTILTIARIAEERYHGKLPDDFAQLTALRGVGPKCANLALGIVSGKAAISVDVHVHRVVNRWGLVHTRQPEQTLIQLEQIIPENRWIDINRLLMPFGKHICTGRLPQCSVCPVLEYCRQVGVTEHR
ncbi:endonuclease III [Pedobacter sp. BS3]|uniref:endonuclease III domain-containing protein n=1 Tax=Pedobacter sp. BS3 TaxID=2567937 RepID=UPI0011ECDB79|nr:endonuclease III [Pedobacter sp. BS3]TZF83035.1 endonuclease III [Pedobacter sp. BS3]